MTQNVRLNPDVAIAQEAQSIARLAQTILDRDDSIRDRENLVSKTRNLCRHLSDRFEEFSTLKRSSK